MMGFQWQYWLVVKCSLLPFIPPSLFLFLNWLYSQIWFTAQPHKQLSRYNCQGEGLQGEERE